MERFVKRKAADAGEGPERPLRTRGVVAVAKFDTSTRAIPHMNKFTTILIHMKPAYATEECPSLSPYYLKNGYGQLCENVWQFGKMYMFVQDIKAHLHRQSPTIIWEDPGGVMFEKVADELVPTEKYHAWRKKGMNNEYAVRWPAGFDGSKSCIGYLRYADGSDPATGLDKDGNKVESQVLGYVEARKQVYCQFYLQHAQQTQAFKDLKARVEAGENIMITEVDGPAIGQHEAPYSSVTKLKPGLVMTKDVCTILLNDDKRPFGHGYVIAAMLADTEGNGESWLK